MTAIDLDVFMKVAGASFGIGVAVGLGLAYWYMKQQIGGAE